MKKAASRLSNGLLAAFVVGMMVLVFFVSITVRSNGETTFKSPVSMSGTWHQNSSDASNVSMTADISDDRIQIFVDDKNSSLLYWDGSFDTSDKTSDSFTLVSTANGDGFLSTATTKTFTYKNGDLSYEFTILGSTRTVHLSRGE